MRSVKAVCTYCNGVGEIAANVLADDICPVCKGSGFTGAAASLPESQPAPEMDALRKLAYSALYCLNIAVEPDIAKDVYSKVHAYIEALRAHDARVQPSRTCCIVGNGMNGHHPQCDRAINNLSPNVMPSQPSSVAGTGRDERWLRCPACHKKAFQRYEIYGDRLKCPKCGEWRNISEYMELTEAESALKESSRGK